MIETNERPQIFAGLVDLARADLGGETLDCSDDFFASMNHLVRPEPAVFDPSAYTDRGKLMDGWESRRKRVPGHDWCIIRLGVPGRVYGVDIDTAHFMGNHPPHASIEAISVASETSLVALRTEMQWTERLCRRRRFSGAVKMFRSVGFLDRGRTFESGFTPMEGWLV